jgi:hypothetical protein
VKRVRGKNILWLALTAILFSMTLTGFAGAYQGTQLRVMPEIINNEDLSIETFTVDIVVEGVEDLYSFAMVLSYSPYVQNLVVSRVTEGDFLKAGGYDTDWVYKIDVFHGEVKMGNARLGQVPGASGTGILATIEFKVEEAGNSPLDLLKVELYSSPPEPALMPVHIHHGRYYGPEAVTTDIAFDPGRAVNMKEYDSVTISATVENTGLVPLDVAVRFDIYGPGVWHQVRGGQSFVTTPRDPVYLYVNEYTPWLEWDWINPGASVIGTPDGNYAESIVDAAMSSEYGFEDLTDMGPSDVIGKVTIEGYCRYPNGPNDGVDIDVYTTSPTVFDWLGSLYGGTDWAWVGPRWIGADVSDVLPGILGGDPTALNSLRILLYNYHGDAANPMQVDALRLKVEFAKFIPIEHWIGTLLPGENATTSCTWLLASGDIGKYTGTATVEYTSEYYSWIQGDPKEFKLKIFDTSK